MNRAMLPLVFAVLWAVGPGAVLSAQSSSQTPPAATEQPGAKAPATEGRGAGTQPATPASSTPPGGASAARGASGDGDRGPVTIHFGDPPGGGGGDGAASTATPSRRPRSRPDAAGRIVRMFDFEERADPRRPDFDPEPVPRHWFRAQDGGAENPRPGFPRHNRAEYELRMHNSGLVSVKLPTRGGSTAMRLSPTLLAVFADADHLVTAMVRTSNLVHSRAFLSAWLVDQRGQMIEGSLRRSEPIISQGAWRQVALELPGAFPEAAFVQIELLLLQPEQFEPRVPAPAGDHIVFQEDFAGEVFFDDVAVYQLPRVTLTSDAAANIAFAPATPTLTGLVRDLSGDQMTAHLVVRDIAGKPVGELKRLLPGGGGTVTMTPTLPAFGWYHAELEVLTGTAVVGHAFTQFLYLPAEETHPTLGGGAQGTGGAESIRGEGSSLGLIVTDRDQLTRSLLPRLIAIAGADAVNLPIWDAGDPAALDQAELAKIRPLLDALLIRGVSVTLAVPRIAPTLAAELRESPDDVLALMRDQDQRWAASMRVVLDLYGQRVQRWQLGESSAPAGLYVPDLAERLARFRSTLGRLVPGPMVTAPWRAEWPLPAPGPAGQPAADVLLVNVPAAFPVPALTELMGSWRALAGSAATGYPRELSAVLQSANISEVSRESALADLLQRAVVSWAALDPASRRLEEPTRLYLPQPWRYTAGASTRQLVPEPTLAVWRAVAKHLGGRRFVGELPAPPGVRAMIFADLRPTASGRRAGVLVVWDAGSPTPDPTISAHLGESEVTRVDVFGNTSTLPPADPTGRRAIVATPTPKFYVGVDPDLALFLESFRITPPFVPSISAEHEHQLVIFNPYPVRITGEVQLLPVQQPAGGRPWRFTPVTPMSFSVGPGQRQLLPFSFSFGPAEEAGPRTIPVALRLIADSAYPPMRVELPINIGLADLDLGVSAVSSQGPQGRLDTVVIATVTNTGSRSRTIELDVSAPGRAQQRQPISNLSPGETAVRRFLFVDGAPLQGRRLRVMLVDVDAAERLNKSVVAP